MHLYRGTCHHAVDDRSLCSRCSDNLKYEKVRYLFYYHKLYVLRGPGSSVGIATDYGMDGPGSSPTGDEIFRPSSPALGSTQPPVQWVPGLSRGKVRQGRVTDHSPPSSAAVMEE